MYKNLVFFSGKWNANVFAMTTYKYYAKKIQKANSVPKVVHFRQDIRTFPSSPKCTFA